jgi:hypothetical protein
MGIEEGEEMQAKCIENIIAENYPNFEKELVIQIRRLLRLKTNKTRKEPPHIILEFNH